MKPVPHVRQEQYHRYLLPAFFVLLDYIAILLAEEAAFGLREVLDLLEHGKYAIASSYVYIWIPLLFILFLGHSRTYKQMQPIIETVREIFYSVFYGLITCIILLYFAQASLAASRLYVLLFGILVFLNICILRYAARKIMKVYSIFLEPIILIGGQKTAEAVLNYFEKDLGYRYKVIGVIDDSPETISIRSSVLLLGNTEEAEKIIKDTGVQTVIITAPGMKKEKLQALISRIQPYVRNISFVPDLIGTPMGSIEVSTLFDEKIILLQISNNLAKRRNRIIKRSLDVFGSLLGMILLSPILLIVSCCIYYQDGIPIIFGYSCVGLNGKRFRCYKFRSMIRNSQDVLQKYLQNNKDAREEWDKYYKLKNDPRVTSVGKVLRGKSLDELAQLWNVLKGDMSLVGPRQIVPDEMKRYGPYLKDRLMVRPGMTGYWQINGRSDVDYEERIGMDIWYIRNWSVWVDLVILFRTVKIVLLGKGAY